MLEPITIGFVWLEHGQGLQPPAQQSAGAAGVDLRAALGVDEELVLAPGKRALVPCGFSMALPQGYEAQVRSRSGLAVQWGVTVLNAPGTIDADYRGEVKIILANFGEQDFSIRRGDRVAQMVVAPVSMVAFEKRETLDDTERGAKGFGSTGHKA